MPLLKIYREHTLDCLLFEPRAIPLADQTAYELIMFLEHAGWTHKKLPASAAEREALVYRWDDERQHWYSPIRPYLLCLAHASVLKEAGATMTDWNGRETYRAGEVIATNGHVLEEVLAIFQDSA